MRLPCIAALPAHRPSIDMHEGRYYTGAMQKKFAIVAGYFDGETYGLLGPQLAATLIREHTGHDSIVVAVTREDDKGQLKKALMDWFGEAPPLIGFSLLGGREDLLDFAREMKDAGAVTVLAGPQADVDFLGEIDWPNHPHRFKGYADHFSLALHGPAEQIFPFLNRPETDAWHRSPGILLRGKDGRFLHNPPKTWEEKYLDRVDWDTIYRLENASLAPFTITAGQVLQQIGCPHAARASHIQVPYPAALDGGNARSIGVRSRGCSFCDVAVDKGFFGALGMDTVLGQIAGLPRGADGRKIPFELINENPLPGLNRLLAAVREKGIAISRINLTLRADGFVRGEAHLRKALETARDMGACLVLTSMGFESFDDSILENLNKGVSVATNMAAVRLIRRFKREFPGHWGYLRSEGGNHGFIHPTPWDSPETEANTRAAVARYRLAEDILPAHSTPLIIHHASCLGDWIRAVEAAEGITFERHGSIIAWWQIGDRFLL